MVVLVNSSSNYICRVYKLANATNTTLGDRVLHRIVIKCYKMLLYYSNVMHKLRNVTLYLHIASFRGLIVPQNFLYIIFFTSVADVYLLSHSLELIREFVSLYL